MADEKNGLVLVDLFNENNGNKTLISKKLVISTIYDDREDMGNHLLEVVNVWKFAKITDIEIRTEHVKYVFNMLGKFRLKEIIDL